MPSPMAPRDLSFETCELPPFAQPCSLVSSYYMHASLSTMLLHFARGGAIARLPYVRLHT
ncbi:CBM_HP2_G0030360.mRNA.1.CDS.1 [Saccharomyces cerevisiae]|nr:CBM_HP2_G0030360.mRNA.1.CDS.1 [Saccharomyces cerevisiae]CAI6565390.1 CBM_HP2_G0030360.mRNA.1.CDS.1 [Saccharomyces cerevisiae]